MTTTNRIRNVGRAASAASVAAPYVRRLATDEDLRSDARDFLRSADRLYKDFTKGDHDRIDTIESGVRRFGGDARRGVRRTLLIGAGIGVLVGGAVTLLVYPRTRHWLMGISSQTRERATGTIRDAREKVGETIGDTREKVGDVREKVSETATGARDKASEIKDEVDEKAADAAESRHHVA